MIVSAIYAESLNHVIGKNGHLPWHLASDMRWFRVTTSGHCVIMGRKNYMDIGHALPLRHNIVLSRDPEFKAPGCTVCSSLDMALKECEMRGEAECFIIGGASVYKEAWPLIDRLYRTEVLAEVDGDVLFPMRPIGWKLVSTVDMPKDIGDDYATRFEVWERPSDIQDIG